jgi:hypothetical protein
MTTRIGLIKQNFFKSWEQDDTITNNLNNGVILAPWGCERGMGLSDNLTKNELKIRINRLFPDWHATDKQLSNNANCCMNFVNLPDDSVMIVSSSCNKTTRWVVKLTSGMRWDDNADTGNGNGCWVRGVELIRTIPYNSVPNGGHLMSTLCVLKNTESNTYRQLSGLVF